MYLKIIDIMIQYIEISWMHAGRKAMWRSKCGPSCSAELRRREDTGGLTAMYEWNKKCMLFFIFSLCQNSKGAGV